MSNTLKVTIASQGKAPLEYEAESLITSSSNGKIQFGYNHAPIIISTIPTTTTVIVNGKREEIFTSYGVVYIKNNEVKFCCDTAELSKDIDKNRAESSKKRAEKRLQNPKDIDIERAKRSLARANARIKTISINH
ncbi:MAG: F0F1 ATP synthase subunit epsilon [Clostridium sp.]|nr:F0F1 ATP synthase subunit epsilon [Clostridium sp.]